jgi:hypothetical protein
MREGHVCDQPAAEESGGALEGPIHELIGDDHVQRRVFLLERAHGGDGEDALHAQRLQGVDVGAEVDLAGRDAMAAPVAGQEGDLAPLERPEDEDIGRRTERGLHRDLVRVRHAAHLVEAAAADDPDLRRPSAQATSRV